MSSSYSSFFKQKTAYEVRISYLSSDVCSSDLSRLGRTRSSISWAAGPRARPCSQTGCAADSRWIARASGALSHRSPTRSSAMSRQLWRRLDGRDRFHGWPRIKRRWEPTSASMLAGMRSEEHTSELQSLMRISYAVFCLKKKKQYQEEIQVY